MSPTCISFVEQFNVVTCAPATYIQMRYVSTRCDIERSGGRYQVVKVGIGRDRWLSMPIIRRRCRDRDHDRDRNHNRGQCMRTYVCKA